MSISKTINWKFNILFLTNQRAHNYYDVRTLKFFPSAECWLVNSNFSRASRMQGFSINIILKLGKVWRSKTRKATLCRSYERGGRSEEKRKATSCSQSSFQPVFIPSPKVNDIYEKIIPGVAADFPQPTSHSHGYSLAPRILFTKKEKTDNLYVTEVAYLSVWMHNFSSLVLSLCHFRYKKNGKKIYIYILH